MPSLAVGVGVNPAMGRWFHDATGDPNGVFLAVISDALWKRLLRRLSQLGLDRHLERPYIYGVGSDASVNWPFHGPGFG